MYQQVNLFEISPLINNISILYYNMSMFGNFSVFQKNHISATYVTIFSRFNYTWGQCKACCQSSDQSNNLKILTFSKSKGKKNKIHTESHTKFLCIWQQNSNEDGHKRSQHDFNKSIEMF